VATNSTCPYAICLAAVAVTAVIVGVSALIIWEPDPVSHPSPDPRPTLRWAEGACVRRTGTTVEPVSCDRASGRVSRIAAAPPDCPEDTDEFVSLEPGRTACVRTLLGPHPGAPGNGGGLLRAGDCIAFAGGERPCVEKGWYGRVIGVAASPKRCPRGTADHMRLKGGSVVCLGGDGQVITTGDCVRRPALATSARRIGKVACSARAAWARVTGRAASAADCPPRSDHYLRFRGSSGVICLRAVG
jgi:hypothetical protein